MDRRRWLMSSVGALGGIAAGGCSGGGASPERGGTTGAVSSPPSSPVRAVPFDVAPLRSPVGRYLGVASEGIPGSVSAVAGWDAACGVAANLMPCYVQMQFPVSVTWVSQACAAGGLPLLQWQPISVTLAQIAAGDIDPYLTSYARAVAALNLPLAVAFAHEMNGNWYPWGMRTAGNTPQQYVAAYRHIVDVFRRTGASSVIWVWAPNVTYPVPDVPLSPLYPGDAYVDWIGIIGYFTQRGRQQFQSLFTPTVDEIRGFTARPWLIVETAGEPGLKVVAVQQLFAGLRDHPDLLGFCWFDYGSSEGKRADWLLRDDPVALAAYHSAAQRVPRQRVDA